MGKIHKNSNKLNLAYPETAARVCVVAKSAKKGTGLQDCAGFVRMLWLGAGLEYMLALVVGG